MIFLIVTLVAVVAAGGGFLVGSRVAGIETVEKCRAKIDAANDKTRAAEQSAQMWRNRATRLEQHQAQLDQDVTASTKMLLKELDKAAGVLCEHGERPDLGPGECWKCDAAPLPTFAKLAAGDGEEG